MCDILCGIGIGFGGFVVDVDKDGNVKCFQFVGGWDCVFGWGKVDVGFVVLFGEVLYFDQLCGSGLVEKFCVVCRCLFWVWCVDIDVLVGIIGVQQMLDVDGKVVVVVVQIDGYVVCCGKFKIVVDGVYYVQQDCICWIVVMYVV